MEQERIKQEIRTREDRVREVGARMTRASSPRAREIGRGAKRKRTTGSSRTRETRARKTGERVRRTNGTRTAEATKIGRGKVGKRELEKTED